jgi:hypothetical protein
LVTQLWEEQRFRRASAALIRGGTRAALEYYLQEIASSGGFTNDFSVKRKADQYFSGNLKERKEVVSLLARYGITSCELLAKAAQLESHGVLTFERLVSSRVNGRRMLRKEAERDAGSQDHDDLAEE